MKKQLSAPKVFWHQYLNQSRKKRRNSRRGGGVGGIPLAHWEGNCMALCPGFVLNSLHTIRRNVLWSKVKNSGFQSPRFYSQVLLLHCSLSCKWSHCGTGRHKDETFFRKGLWMVGSGGPDPEQSLHRIAFPTCLVLASCGTEMRVFCLASLSAKDFQHAVSAAPVYNIKLFIDPHPRIKCLKIHCST